MGVTDAAKGKFYRLLKSGLTADQHNAVQIMSAASIAQINRQMTPTGKSSFPSVQIGVPANPKYSWR